MHLFSHTQFFITFKSCRHLDFKHSVFGRVVGGLDILAAMERLDTDEDDRPTTPVAITGEWGLVFTELVRLVVCGGLGVRTTPVAITGEWAPGVC